METKFFTQPEFKLGKAISDALEKKPFPVRVFFVSAFVSYQTLLRVKDTILFLRKNDTEINFTLGIDLGGTSIEVLNELCNWDVNTIIVKNSIPGHTFHPKIFIIEWKERAVVYVGSNNLTEGGFFRNYECYTRTLYNLNIERDEYLKTLERLSRFVKPSGPTSLKLNKKLVIQLIKRNEIPSENKSLTRKEAKIIRKSDVSESLPSLFGTEDFERPPPLPAHILKSLVSLVSRKSREKRKKGVKLEEPKEVATIFPVSFFMTLPKLQSPKIPGEARIPLEALEVAEDFWGWPKEYERSKSPRKGKNRVYWNWKPNWLFWSVENPENKTPQAVRMYIYENSSDFRFYMRKLVDSGADSGDIIRITRIAQKDVEFECVLAKKGTAEFERWLKFCTQAVRNSKRRYGYA
jgi:hypothetical protein